MRDKTKQPTRAQAERAIAKGENPLQFKDHPNYHVRRKAWERDGRKLLGGAANWPSDLQFLQSIRVREPERFKPSADAQIVATTAEVAIEAPSEP